MVPALIYLLMYSFIYLKRSAYTEDSHYAANLLKCASRHSHNFSR